MRKKDVPKIAESIEAMATVLGVESINVYRALVLGSLISNSDKNQVMQHLDPDVKEPLNCDYCDSCLNSESYYKLMDGPGTRKNSCSRCANNAGRRSLLSGVSAS